MIEFEVQGLVGVATINRPERRNALNGDLCTLLRDHLVAAPRAARGRHHRRRLRVLRGRRSRRRASRRPNRTTTARSTRFRPAFELMLDAIVDHPAPVIAAVNGPAMGAGMQLAVACDLRVAGPDARFAIPAGRLGVHLSPRNIWRLAMLAGQGSARDFLLAGRSARCRGSATARHRAAFGRRRAGRRARARARDRGIGSALGARPQARAQPRGRGAVAVAGRASEVAALEVAAFASDDLQEGMAAFAEKRTPDFKGS